MTRVVIVDDQAMMRAALRTILEAADIDVVGEAGDGTAAVAAARQHRPDVVLMDVRMPGRDGISATAEIARDLPETRVLVLTRFDDDDVLYGALAAGAAGFLLKNSSPEDLVRAIALVDGGDAVLDPTVTGRVLSRFAGRTPLARTELIDRLTEREKDVLALVSQGLTKAEIAARLAVGEATAKTHVSRVLAKLGVRDRLQAGIVAYETGFAPTDRAVG